MDQKMKVFISWSGTKSGVVATFLRQWLTDVLQTLEPWMSKTDIEGGGQMGCGAQPTARRNEVRDYLLERANLTAPWILFEAVAVAKAIPDKPAEPRVCPYCIDLKPTDIPQGPLSQFQAKFADAEGTWDLLKAVNNQSEKPLPQDTLERVFKQWRPDLQDALATHPMTTALQPMPRQPAEILTEILSIVRDMQRVWPVMWPAAGVMSWVPVTGSEGISTGIISPDHMSSADLMRVMSTGVAGAKGQTEPTQLEQRRHSYVRKRNKPKDDSKAE